MNETPIIFKGEVLGVIIGFTRTNLPEEARPWSVAYVRSRQEKVLARYLVQKHIPFYLPQTENEVRTRISSRPDRADAQPPTDLSSRTPRSGVRDLLQRRQHRLGAQTVAWGAPSMGEIPRRPTAPSE